MLQHGHQSSKELKDVDVIEQPDFYYNYQTVSVKDHRDTKSSLSRNSERPGSIKSTGRKFSIKGYSSPSAKRPRFVKSKDLKLKKIEYAKLQNCSSTDNITDAQYSKLSKILQKSDLEITKCIDVTVTPNSSKNPRSASTYFKKDSSQDLAESD